MSTNLYEVLGINSHANADQVKRAYRKLCAQHHPDRGGGTDARMSEINDAYAVLSDPKRREYYDNTGEVVNPSEVHAQARQYVIQGVTKFFEGGFDSDDPIVQTRADFLHNIAINKGGVRMGKDRIEKLTRKLQRLKRKDPGREDFLTGALEKRIEAVEAEVRTARRHVEVMEAAVNLLDQYEFEPHRWDAPPPATPAKTRYIKWEPGEL